MSGFSPEWLALREPVDHRSRDAVLALRLQEHFVQERSIKIVDLGCGTGSNLRGTFHLLPDEQSWTLVDYDPQLLVAARRAIRAWADSAESQGGEGGPLVVNKAGKRLAIDFRRLDLNTDLETALGVEPQMVTASAFFDLCSPDFIGRLAAAVAARRAVFFTVLTYNGQQTWTPSHPADRRMLSAFIAHQGSDKGFGASAGPMAAPSLGATFQSARYDVHEGDSPWMLGHGDERLVADLADGFAAAVTETGAVDAATVMSWREIKRTAAVVGHTDTLAIPA